jgi:hypothetical protein
LKKKSFSGASLQSSFQQLNWFIELILHLNLHLTFFFFEFYNWGTSGCTLLYSLLF